MSPTSAFQSADEMSSRFDRAETVEIVMPSCVETHKLLRLVGHCKQPLTEGDRNGAVLYTMHDQERCGDPLDALVGSEGVLQQVARRQERIYRRGDVRHRRIGRFENQSANRMLRGERDSNSG